MVIQIANIVSGFLLGAPKLKEFGAKEQVESLSAKLSAFAGPIGVIELVLGVMALIQRLGIAYFPIHNFGASFPQALVAIAMGLIMSAHLFENFSALHDFIVKLKAYDVWIGILGIVIGLWSLLFGCSFCM